LHLPARHFPRTSSPRRRKGTQLDYPSQPPTGHLHPNFVPLRHAARILVVETKRSRDWSNDDSKEKHPVGEWWQERSNGRCLFVTPKDREWGTLRAKVGG